MCKYLAILIAVLFIGGCAAVQPPPGGPEDKSSPEMEETVPLQGALNVSRTSRLHFLFKQNIERNSFMSAISVTPYLSGLVKYNWYGYDEVEVVLPDTLRANSTYIVTLSKDLKTIHGGSLKEPFQLIFSTGSLIDTGIISGAIFAPMTAGSSTDLKNVSVFAYDITNLFVDTLELDKVRPDYITQPSDKGIFQFKAMKSGHRYRMLALNDEFRNKVYDDGIDSYGMSTSDVTLEGATLGGVRIRMSPKVDTSSPRLQDWDVSDAYHIKIRFTKSIDSASVNVEHFSLRDSITGAEVPVIAAYRENIDKKGGAVTLLLKTPMSKKRTYILFAKPDVIKDPIGHHLDSLFSKLEINKEEFRDTFPAPRFDGFPYIDSARGVAPELDVVLSFSNPIDTSLFQNGFQLLDSNKRALVYHLRWLDGIRARLQMKLLPKAFYRFILKTSSVKTPSSVPLRPEKDTVISSAFFTGDITEYGTISGQIIVSDSILQSAHCVIRLSSEGGGWTQILQLKPHIKTYTFENIPKGLYRVQAWITAREDGGYEGGKPKPLKFALPSGDYPDAIDVRPRWTVEHIDIPLQ